MASTGPGESFDSEAMFLWYYNQGDRRTYLQVAEHFDCAYNTVRSYADKHDWDGRGFQIDEDSKRQLNRRLANVIAKQRAADIDTLRVLTGKFRRRLADKIQTAEGLDVPNPVGLADADITVQEYLAVIKTFELLTGGATERLGSEDTERLDLAAVDREIEELDRQALERGQAVDV